MDSTFSSAAGSSRTKSFTPPSGRLETRHSRPRTARLTERRQRHLRSAGVAPVRARRTAAAAAVRSRAPRGQRRGDTRRRTGRVQPRHRTRRLLSLGQRRSRISDGLKSPEPVRVVRSRPASSSKPSALPATIARRTCRRTVRSWHTPTSLFGDIWILDLARKTTSRFTSGPGNETAPVWFPDGTKIVYRIDQRRPVREGLYRDRSGATCS